MKMKYIILFIALLSAGILGCKTDNKNTDTVTTDTLAVAKATAPVSEVALQASSEGTAVVINENDVPDTIKKTFMIKYPQIQRAEWYKYQPVTDDDLEMDDSYYYVRYNNDGADYTSWYNNNGEWVKTSTKVPGNKNLPDPVNRYINANYPGYVIEEISKENDKNMDMYEIKLTKGDSKVKLKILPNGRIFKKKVS